MPLSRIEIPAGRPPAYGAGIADAVQEALHHSLGVPMDERFQIVTAHEPGGLLVHPNYLGIGRSADAVIVQIFLNAGRDIDKKRALYRALADRLHAAVGIRREDVVVSLVEVQRNDWSFGCGEAQLAAADSPASTMSNDQPQ
jgi:4-oxalocrotonate tautomerase